MQAQGLEVLPVRAQHVRRLRYLPVQVLVNDGFSAKRDAAEKAGEPEWKVILEKKSLYEDISAEVQRGNYAMFKENSVGTASGALQRDSAANAELEAQHPE